MKPKVLGALICVMIMVACPLIPMAADTEAADDSTGAATIKITNMSKTSADELLGTGTIQSMITNSLYSPLGLNTSIYYNSKATYDISEITLEEGAKSTINGDKTSQSGYYYTKMSCKFSFTYDVQSTDGITIIGSSGGYQGDGMIQLLKKFGESKVKTGDTVRIYGSFSYIYLAEANAKDIFHTADNKYYSLNDSMVIKTMNTHDVTVKIKDSTITDKYEFKQEQKGDSKWEFVNGDKIDYKYGRLESMKGSLSQTTQSSGTKVIDGKSYGYESAAKQTDYNYSVGPAMSSLGSDLKMESTVHYNDLPYLTMYPDDNTLLKALDKVNAYHSQDPAKTDESYRSISSQASVGSSDNDGMTWWVVIILIVVLVIVAIACLFLTKKIQLPSKKDDMPPAQPPQNDGQGPEQ